MSILGTKGILGAMISYFGSDIRRINHALKVYGYAKAIAESEGVDTERKRVIEASSLLHDIGIKESERKYNSSAGNYQEIEGPPVARELLDGLGMKGSWTDRVCYVIGNHHSFDKIDDIDFQILVEADLLVSAFEENLSTEIIAKLVEALFKTNAGKAFALNINR